MILINYGNQNQAILGCHEITNEKILLLPALRSTLQIFAKICTKCQLDCPNDKTD